MNCIRIHTFVHMYVCMFVCTCKQANSVCNFVWQIRRQSSALTLFLSLPLITSWREKRRYCNQSCHRLELVTWVTTAQQLSNKSIGIYFSFFSSIISQVFFLSYSSRMNQQLWFCSHCRCLCRCSAAALVSCCSCVHWRELRVHNSYFTFDSPLFLVSAPHSSICPLKQLWYTHTHTNRQCSYSFYYFLDSVAPNPSDAAFNLSLCLHNPIVCLVWGDASLRKNIIIRFYISFMHFFSFSSLRC